MTNPADKLFEIAESQQGYFTFQQAVEAGYSDTNHSYFVKRSDWIRAYRGIYRLAHYPIGQREELVVWYLWSRNRTDIPQGVYSHYTALDIYELSDHMPSKLHMTVPVGFRRMSKAPEILVLHKKKLLPEEIVEMQGYKITTAMRALIDVIEEGKLQKDLVDQAISDAVKKGLVTKTKVSEFQQIYASSSLGKIQKILRDT